MAILLFCFQRLSWGYEDCGGAVWGDSAVVKEPIGIGAGGEPPQPPARLWSAGRIAVDALGVWGQFVCRAGVFGGAVAGREGPEQPVVGEGVQGALAGLAG